MVIEIKTWLYDILNAITEIDSFFEDSPKEFYFFTKAIPGQDAPLKETLRLLAKQQNAFFRKTIQ
jgi:hypothetical protein